MVVAAENPDQSIALIVFNPTEQQFSVQVQAHSQSIQADINSQALQTILFTHR
jgi:glucosylceramidase